MTTGQETLDRIQNEFTQALEAAKSAEAVEQLRIRHLGRNGEVTNARKNVDFRAMDPEERKSFGQRFNELKSFVEERLAEAQSAVKTAVKPSGAIDMTLPGGGGRLGSLHPISLVQMELEQIFQAMGFVVLTGNDVETEHHNFDSLNIPADHPAREMQDTFWLKNGLLLRTHTSSYQTQAMRKMGVPLRAIFPGRCFRYEAVDASHENTFYQLEGLMVDKNISIANLIAVLKALVSAIFHKEMNVRLRPGFFPFVEPGFETDIQCVICDGRGCPTCKRSGWVELIPCGLVHPNVLRHGGVDPDEYSGFAFGLGLTRLAMMKFNIPEIRLFNSGDIRFYQQFPAAV